MTILVIDDEAMILTMASKILTRSGFDVLTSDGGAGGIEVFSRHRDDIGLVLLDWTMPEMSGEDTLRHLRKLSPDLACIISSGHVLSAEAVPEDLRDRVYFLEKPYRSGALIDMIKGVLEDSRLSS